MNPGIALFVIAATLLSILGCLWLMWWTSHGASKAGAQETTHVWDEDLTEYNNPLPRWWLWMFIFTILFGVAYLALFPGLGNYAGLLHWSSAGEFRADDSKAQHNLEQRFVSYKDKSLLELSKDPAAMATAKNLFALNCSTCHGSDARGAKGFPNLTDNDWLWGGDEATIYKTIAEGRDNTMPTWGAVLGNDGVRDMVIYVLSLSGREVSGPPPLMATSLADGKAKFQALCIACHGPEGKGNQALGAPNLTDRIWLHGGTYEDIYETISKGRVNHMPPHLERLGETRVRLLAAYVLTLSPPPAAARAADAPHALQ